MTDGIVRRAGQGRSFAFGLAPVVVSLEGTATAFPAGGGPPDPLELATIYARWGQEIVP